MTWDREHGCAMPGRNGMAVHLGEPLTVAEIAQLEDGAEVTITWSGGNGPHAYRILVDLFGTRRVENLYTDALLRPAQRLPLHRVTRGWTQEARAQEAERAARQPEHERVAIDRLRRLVK